MSGTPKEKLEKELKSQKSKFDRIREAYINEVFTLKEYNQERKKVEDIINDLETKLNENEVCEKLKFTPNDILVKRNIDFINSIKYPDKFKQRQKINKLNNQTKDLNTKSEEINNIINNLKNQLLSNKNLLLSNQNKEKIIDYIEEVSKSTNDFKKITNYSLSVDKIKEDFEENHELIEDLRKRVKVQNEEIKDSLNYWKNKFQRVVKFIHDKIHGIFGDKDEKYKEMADNLFINGIFDEKEYTSVINKKEKNRDSFER